MSGAHAVLPPSGQWMNCAQWTTDDTESDAAKEGTVAHSLLEKCLQHWLSGNEGLGAKAADWVGTKINTLEVTSEMAAAVQECIDYVHRRVAEKPGAQVCIEIRLSMDDIDDRIWGTSDILLIWPDEIEVIDYKHGKGIIVLVEESDQARIYGDGALNHPSVPDTVQQVTTTIVQPRAGDPVVRTVAYDLDGMAQWRAHYAYRASVYGTEGAVPGEKQCQFCARKATCAVLAEEGLRRSQAVFQPLQEIESLPATLDTTIRPALGDVTVLTPDQLRQVLDVEDLMISFYKAVRAHVTELARTVGFDGYKLVAGQKSRGWDVETDAEIIKLIQGRKKTDGRKVTKAEAYAPAKPLSPAQAEKTIKPQVSAKTWNAIKKHITEKPGAPKLVHESHSGKAIPCSQAVMSDAVDENENTQAEGLAFMN